MDNWYRDIILVWLGIYNTYHTIALTTYLFNDRDRGGKKGQNTAAAIAVQEPIPVPYIQSKRARTLHKMLAGAI